MPARLVLGRSAVDHNQILVHPILRLLSLHDLIHRAELGVRRGGPPQLTRAAYVLSVWVRNASPLVLTSQL